MDMNWVDTQEMNIWGIKYWSVFDTDMSLMIQVLQRKKNNMLVFNHRKPLEIEAMQRLSNDKRIISVGPKVFNV